MLYGFMGDDNAYFMVVATFYTVLFYLYYKLEMCEEVYVIGFKTIVLLAVDFNF